MRHASRTGTRLWHLFRAPTHGELRALAGGQMGAPAQGELRGSTDDALLPERSS